MAPPARPEPQILTGKPTPSVGSPTAPPTRPMSQTEESESQGSIWPAWRWHWAQVVKPLTCEGPSFLEFYLVYCPTVRNCSRHFHPSSVVQG